MKYISILRGINVSGQKKIKMADLKSLYERQGFQNVVTYIQSGNVLFNADTQNKAELKTTIENAITEKYAFQVPVVICSQHDFNKIITNNPFDPVKLVADGTKILVTFLSAEPEEGKIADLQQHVAEPEQLQVMGKEVSALPKRLRQKQTVQYIS